jgi:serine/threonine protein phosphatase 1
LIARFLNRLTGAASPASTPAPRRQRLMLTLPSPLIYAVGDVHGCYDELVEVQARIVADAAGHVGPKVMVLLGDYVDRGPRSADVLDLLLGAPPPGFRRICLAGNHDDLMLRFTEDPATHMNWLKYGGDTTLRSYGLDIAHLVRTVEPSRLKGIVLEAIPQAHLAFLDRLPVALVCGGFLFVHAGMKPGVQLSDQTDHDLMYMREPFLSEGPGLAATVVHGHTPAQDVTWGANRIGIDTGAYMTGKLSVLRIHGQRATVL